MSASSIEQNKPALSFSLCIKEASYAFAALTHHVSGQSPLFQERYMQDVSAQFVLAVKRDMHLPEKDCLGFKKMMDVVPMGRVAEHYENQKPEVRLGFALTAMKNAACTHETRRSFLAAQDDFFLDAKTAQTFRGMRREVIDHAEVKPNGMKSLLVDLIKKDPDVNAIQEETLDLFDGKDDPFKDVLNRKVALDQEFWEKQMQAEKELKVQNLDETTFAAMRSSLQQLFAESFAIADKAIVPDLSPYGAATMPSVMRIQNARKLEHAA